MPSRSLVSLRVLRTACMALAILGCLGNVALAVLYPWALPALGEPMPLDAHFFVVDCILSLTLGFAGLMALRPGSESLSSLVVLGKGLYTIATLVLCTSATSSTGTVAPGHPFYEGLAVWDALVTIVFCLYWIAAKGDPLFQLRIDVFDGLAVAARVDGKRALLLRLPGPAGAAPGLDAVRAGLVASGYEIDLAEISAAPLPAGRDWDLVVLESPDARWDVPPRVEAMLRDPANRPIFQGRDAAVVTIARGAHRRATATMVEYLQRAGANVVAARTFDDDGPDGRGIFPKAEPPASYALSAPSAKEAETFGRSLAERSRTRLHWTLLMPRGGEGGEHA
jgi:hypothetical protein